MLLALGFFLRDKSIILKPSYLFVVFFILQVQLGSTLGAERTENEFLVDPWTYFMLVQIFPLTVLLFSSLFLRRTARINYQRITQFGNHLSNINLKSILLSGTVLFFLLWYLMEVPPSKTGLFAVLFNPTYADIAREESFAELNNPILQYGFYFMASVLAPLSIVFLYLSFCNTKAKRKLLPYLWIIPTAAFILISVSVYGARGPAGMLMLVVIFAYFLRNGASINPLKIMFLLGLVLFLPGLIAFLKNDYGFELELIAQVGMDIFDRAIGRGYISNAWTIDYVQQKGFFGIAGIPKLAALIGETPISVRNLIYLEYYPMPHPTGTADSTFVVLYYSLFGMIVFIPCIILTLSLDLILLFYKRLIPSTLLACVCALVIPILGLSHTQFTTALVTKGFLLIPATCYGVDIIFRSLLPHKASRILATASAT